MERRECRSDPLEPMPQQKMIVKHKPRYRAWPSRPSFFARVFPFMTHLPIAGKDNKDSLIDIDRKL